MLSVNAYVNISRELRNFFSTNSILRYIFPLDVIIMFASLILIFLDNTVGVNIGGFLRALTYWTFILGLLMTYASLKERPLYIGLFGYGAIHLINFMKSLFGGGYFSCPGFFGFAVYAGLGYLVLRKVLAGAAARTR